MELAELVFWNGISSGTGLRRKGVGHTIIRLTCAHVRVHGIQIKAHFATSVLNDG